MNTRERLGRVRELQQLWRELVDVDVEAARWASERLRCGVQPRDFAAECQKLRKF